MNLTTMNNHEYGYRKLSGFLVLILLTAGSFAWSFDTKTSKAKLQALMSIDGKDLTEKYGASEILSFDVSPDNQTVVVGYRTAEQHHTASISVGKWEIASKRLLATARLEESTDQDSAFVRLVFTPDGQLLISQTDHAINILDPNTLAIKRTIQISGDCSQLSGDGHILAVRAWSQGKSSVHILDARSGEQLGLWPEPEAFQHTVCPPLSFGGDQMLITAPGSGPNILLVDSLTGKVIRSFSIGFRHERASPDNEIGSAAFIDTSRLIVAPSSDPGKSGRYSAKTLKVINANTGELIHELVYRHLAPGHAPWVSASGSTLALINAWRSRSQNLSDADANVPIQLLLFRLDTTQPTCVVENLPMSGSTPEGATSAVKPSPDLGIFGFRISNQLTIYKIIGCNLH